MTIRIDLKGVYNRLSDANLQKGQQNLANRAYIDMNENFVPMLHGNLRDLSGVASDGSHIFWNSVYARVQYRGTNKKAVFNNYTTPGTGPYWDIKAKGIFMSDWINAFTKGAGL